MSIAVGEYFGFLAKTVTVLVAILVVIAVIVASRMKDGKKREGHIKVRSMNDFYKDLHNAVDQAFMSKVEKKAAIKAKKAETKQTEKSPSELKSRVYVLDFNGDTSASAVDSLRHEVTAILSHAKTTDEVVMRLESPGGVVHGYGLAATQLARLRSADIPLTICVDKVAASGGYMMACVANKIVTAPFAILGSIGVVAQMPNINRLLKKHDVDIELITAGQYKRTLTLVGENTAEGREKFQEEVNAVQTLFKLFVSKFRPELDVHKVATGESWYGSTALALNLADQIGTSDDYLSHVARTRDVLEISYELPKKGGLKERLGLAAANVAETVLMRIWTRAMAYRGY